MAGTDKTRPSMVSGGPVFILVEPQLGENIGMAARAMLNCGLDRLRLVKPRDGWPNESAVAASADAHAVIDAVDVFDSTEDAVADLGFVLATTARPRDMTVRVLAPRHAVRELADIRNSGADVGILFGRESKGLKNDDIVLSDAIVTAPLNPAFSSLNLAQAVFCLAYEWRLLEDETPADELAVPKSTRPANKDELIGFFEHLERELDASGFLRVTEKRPVMVRNLRNLFERAGLTEQEVRTLRGVVASLTRNREKPDE